MNNFEHILDLLQKSSLSEVEKLKLEEILKNDLEAKEFYNTYIKLGKALKKTDHISFDELKDFILVKNNLEPEDQNILAKIPWIEAHLRQCAACTDQFSMINSEYADVENFLTEKFAANSNKTVDSNSNQLRFFRKLNPQYYAFAAVLLIGVLFGSLFLVSELTTPSAIKHASLEDKSDFYISRGRTTDYFQESISALDNEDYNTAISYLKKDIQENSNSETIFYTHYVLGLVYLEIAESDFIGLFPSYNKSNAKDGLKNLQLSIEKNLSGKYQNLSMNAHFYIAKAYLMLDDKENAKKYLKKVIDEKGSKMIEAENILSDLE
jgi:tetratricopeptide (TPR) repeat protein